MYATKLLKSCLTIVTMALFWFALPAFAGYDELNLRQGVTPISKEVYELHMIILYVVTVIAVLVFGAMFWSIYYHRKSRGAVAAQFHHNTLAEISWTVIPIIILVAMAVPATKTLIKMEETGDAEITIKVTGYQWKWHYEYLNEDFGFFSVLDSKSEEIRQLGSGLNPADHEHYLLDVDKRVVVPTNTKIRILTTAADVLHAWWVPDLGWKRDAIPGFINDNWTFIEEPGVYRGQCAELCGKDHGFMPIVVEAVSPEEYAAWVDEQKAAASESICAGPECTKDELMAAGEKIYGTQCAACHGATGAGIPGAFPALAGSAITVGDPAGHIDIVLNGKPGTAMAAFGGVLNDEDLAAVITYERNSWGNDTGDLVQPADVAAAR